MFRFTIRELVLLTLVVAMGVGWWLDRTRLTEARRISELVWQDVVDKSYLREVSLQIQLDALRATEAQPPSPQP